MAGREHLFGNEVWRYAASEGTTVLKGELGDGDQDSVHRLFCLTRFKAGLVWKSQLSRWGCAVFLHVVLLISMFSMYFRPFTT